MSFQESSWRLKRIFSTIKKVAPDNKVADLLLFYLGLEKNNPTVTTTYLDYLTLYKQCKDYNPEIVKDFNLIDKHDTPEGKNAYNSRIRQFLLWLGEEKLCSTFIFLSDFFYHMF